MVCFEPIAKYLLLLTYNHTNILDKDFTFMLTCY